LAHVGEDGADVPVLELDRALRAVAEERAEAQIVFRLADEF
jgi:hypothetical protein